MSVRKNHILMYTFLTLCVFTISIGKAKASDYVNYYNITMNNQEYNNLINLGFSEDEIYYMDLETFEQNKNIEGTLVAKTDKYYKSVYTGLDGNDYSVEVSKDEYENQGNLLARGTVSTEYKHIVSTMTDNSGTFRYKVSVSWKQMPSTKSYDIIGVGFNDDVYISTPVYFAYYYCNSDGDCTTSTQYYLRQKTATGGSAVYKWPQEAASMSATLYYDVSKNTTDTITRLDMYGDYAHATTNLSSSSQYSHDITHNGIILGSNISYFDATPCAETTWYGSW